MRQRATRGPIALCTVLAVLAALVGVLTVRAAPTASAVTKQFGDRVCSMYANSNGFGAYCSSGVGYSGPPPTWRDVLGPRTFIPCRDFDVPAGIKLAPPPDGKQWVLRLTIADYDLNQAGGGAKAHIERAMVPVSAQDSNSQCPKLAYMDQFWREFHSSYPSPVLVVKPTYTPRVNVPAYFALTPESAMVQKTREELGAILAWNGDQFLTMRAVVGRMTVDPGDGSKPFNCLMNIDNVGGDGYDETVDPFSQTSRCKHVYKRSSAKQPDGMYTVKLGIWWDVAYWKDVGGVSGWTTIGSYQVQAVQRLPVQEVQAIGG